MARKKKSEEHENHERWLISYADFITLLFAFFVVMYSMSSVNEGKYRVLSQSMAAAFSPTTRSISPIQVGELARSPPSIFPTIVEIPKPINIIPVLISRNIPALKIQSDFVTSEFDSILEEASFEIETIATAIAESFETLIDDEQISLRKTPFWLEVEINSNILFNSASAELSIDAEELLSKLGVLLNSYPNRINVEGFTDDRPIQSPIYPSNWELSSARASAVVRLFEVYGIKPNRMSSVGYGEYRPKNENDTAIGRASNRRVIVVVMANIRNRNQGSNIPFTDLELFLQRTTN